MITDRGEILLFETRLKKVPRNSSPHPGETRIETFLFLIIHTVFLIFIKMKSNVLHIYILLYIYRTGHFYVLSFREHY